MPTYRPRNPYALHPLMKKGGAHQKGKSAQRRQIKQQLDNDIDEWFDIQEDKTEKRSKERFSIGCLKRGPSKYLTSLLTQIEALQS